MWRLHRNMERKASGHMGHLTFCGMVWVTMWRFRDPLVLKLAWHTEQWNSRLLVWLFRCTFSVDEDTKWRSHLGHLYGLAPAMGSQR